MKKCPNCGTKYKDTDFYCLKDNYRLILCNNDELTEEDKLRDIRDNELYKHPNKHGNFTTNTINNIPHCPVCNSSNIHKISKTNKVGSVALFGIFAIGHVSKTFKCNNCGYIF